MTGEIVALIPSARHQREADYTQEQQSRRFGAFPRREASGRTEPLNVESKCLRHFRGNVTFRVVITSPPSPTPWEPK